MPSWPTDEASSDAASSCFVTGSVDKDGNLKVGVCGKDSGCKEYSCEAMNWYREEYRANKMCGWGGICTCPDGARQTFAEHFFRSNALYCTATARILIPAERSAVS